MQKFILLFLLILFASYKLISQDNYYVTAGVNYLSPLGKLKKMNQESAGIMLQIESRHYCHIWYGIRIDYNNLKPAKDILLGENYFKKSFLISPEIKYVFNNGENYQNQLMFYLNLLFHISSISSLKNDNPRGAGGSAGLGLIYCFIISQTCLSLDLNSLYSSPNFILRDDLRQSISFLNLSISLGVRL